MWGNELLDEGLCSLCSSSCIIYWNHECFSPPANTPQIYATFCLCRSLDPHAKNCFWNLVAFFPPCCSQLSYFLFFFHCPPFSLFFLCTCTLEQRRRGASSCRTIAGEVIWGQRFRAGITEPASVAVLFGTVSYACCTHLQNIA